MNTPIPGDRVITVTNSSGTYTDVWVSGKYSRLPYSVHPATAISTVLQMRKRIEGALR